MNNQITTFEAACEALNIATTLPDVSGLPERFQKSAIANYKLDVVNAALNGDWVPDWNNSDYKYYPWWDMETYGDAPAGSGFAFTVVASAHVCSNVGSRRVFETQELAKHAAKHFIDVYRDAMIIQK